MEFITFFKAQNPYLSQKKNLSILGIAEAKSKVDVFRRFSKVMDFDGLGLCSCFNRKCCLHAGIHGLNGTFIFISGVLMSGVHLQNS